ncbi:MAG: hypothetical protein AB7P31_04930 [Steroidobacteraceae bacterium]
MTQIAVQDAEHVERVERSAGGELAVYSARGIGSFALAAGTRLPVRICFFHDASRAFGRLEGFELVRIGDDGAERPVAAKTAGACARVSATLAPGAYRVRFVDYYR